MRLQPTNPMNGAMAGFLVCEVIVFVLAWPGMVMVSNISVLWSGVACILACVLCVVAAARLRRPEGYPLGWLVQVLAVLMGILTPMMYLVGAIFLALWALSFVLGRRLEKNAGQDPARGH